LDFGDKSLVSSISPFLIKGTSCSYIIGILVQWGFDNVYLMLWLYMIFVNVIFPFSILSMIFHKVNKQKSFFKSFVLLGNYHFVYLSSRLVNSWFSCSPRPLHIQTLQYIDLNPKSIINVFLSYSYFWLCCNPFGISKPSCNDSFSNSALYLQTFKTYCNKYLA
jgi:hypothetical protein